jgi:hypothetical protein
VTKSVIYSVLAIYGDDGGAQSVKFGGGSPKLLEERLLEDSSSLDEETPMLLLLDMLKMLDEEISMLLLEIFSTYLSIGSNILSVQEKINIAANKGKTRRHAKLI